MPIDASLFMQFANQRAQENANLGNALSQGINNYTTGRARREELDLKRQELAKTAFDIDKLSSQAAYKAFMGIPLTQDDKAALQVKSLFEGQKTTYQPDANGVVQAVSQPTIWDRFQQMSPGQQYQGTFPPLNQAQPAQGGMAQTNMGPMPTIGMEELLPPPALTQQQQQALSDRGDPFIGNAAPLPNIVKPYVRPGADKTDVNVAEKQIDLQAKNITNQQDLDKKAKESVIAGFELKPGVIPTDTQRNELVKINASYNQLMPMFDEYSALIEKYGAPVAGTEEAQELERKSGAIRMTLKELEQLGALQDADITAMDAMMGNPVLFGGGISDIVDNPIKSTASTVAKLKSGKKIGIQSSKDMQKYLTEKLKTNAEARGYVMKGPKNVSSNIPSEAVKIGVHKVTGKNVYKLPNGKLEQY